MADQVHPDGEGFTPRMQGWLNVQKSVQRTPTTESQRTAPTRDAGFGRSVRTGSALPRANSSAK